MGILTSFLIAPSAFTPPPLPQALVEIPYVTLQTALYSLVTFFMIGFPMYVANFFWYFFFTWLCLVFFT